MLIKIKTNYKNKVLIGDKLESLGGKQILLLHGGGKNSSKERFTKLRHKLFLNGYSSFSFDFIGHGETGGNLFETNLLDRTDQAEKFISKNITDANFSIIGTSMGAYTAIKLLEKCENIRSLVLIVPAVYDKSAYLENFGENFSRIIRKDRSWNNTDAWDILTNFHGRLIIVYSNDDEIIPFEIIERLFCFATNIEKKDLYCVKNSSHQIFNYLNNNDGELNKLTDTIINSLKNAK